MVVKLGSGLCLVHVWKAVAFRMANVAKQHIQQELQLRAEHQSLVFLHLPHSEVPWKLQSAGWVWFLRHLLTSALCYLTANVYCGSHEGNKMEHQLVFQCCSTEASLGIFRSLSFTTPHFMELCTNSAAFFPSFQASWDISLFYILIYTCSILV